MTVQKQLLGRGTYGPDVVYGPEVSPLWQFFLAPPAQNSVLIYTDGSVVERATFENNVIQGDDVQRFILGGTDFRTDEGSADYVALTDAGYTWRNVYTDDSYEETYDNPYNMYNNS